MRKNLLEMNIKCIFVEEWCCFVVCLQNTCTLKQCNTGVKSCCVVVVIVCLPKKKKKVPADFAIDLDKHKCTCVSGFAFNFFFFFQNHQKHLTSLFYLCALMSSDEGPCQLSAAIWCSAAWNVHIFMHGPCLPWAIQFVIWTETVCAGASVCSSVFA